MSSEAVPEQEPTRVFFREIPPVFVAVAGGRAVLHAYLTGYDMATEDTQDAAGLALALQHAGDLVRVINRARPVSHLPSQAEFYAQQQRRATVIETLERLSTGEP